MLYQKKCCDLALIFYKNRSSCALSRECLYAMLIIILEYLKIVLPGMTFQAHKIISKTHIFK